jgi:hypothetical protein
MLVFSERKNIRPGDQGTEVEPQSKSLRSIKDLPDPEHFFMGDDRGELKDLGEGTKIRVQAPVNVVIRRASIVWAMCKSRWTRRRFLLDGSRAGDGEEQTGCNEYHGELTHG